MIGKETIESIKQGVDLVALIQSRGISLKKNGRGYVGLCPFHKDKKPSLSVNVETNLWQCFGCGAGGDVIRFVELFDKVPFPQAVKKLESETSKLKVDHEAKPVHPEASLTTKELKLLERVVSYYQHTFTQDHRGLNYLKNDRGITDPQSLKDFGAGYVNGTLLEILPQDEEVINALKKIVLQVKLMHSLLLQRQEITLR
jgi:DNA primase catalytic core